MNKRSETRLTLFVNHCYC